jgi:hypothetical protein
MVALDASAATAMPSVLLDKRHFTAPATAARAPQPHQFSLAIATILTPSGKGRFVWEGAIVVQEEGQKPRGGLVKGTCERGRRPSEPALLCTGTRFAFTDQDSFTMALDGSEARLEQRYRDRWHNIQWSAQGEPLHDARQCPDGGSEVTLIRPAAVEGHLFGHDAKADPQRGDLLLNFLVKRAATTPCPEDSPAHSMEFSGSGVSLFISGARNTW